MITISTAQNVAVKVSPDVLTLLVACHLVTYSLERMRFEASSTKVTPYVLESFARQVTS